MEGTGRGWRWREGRHFEERRVERIEEIGRRWVCLGN